MILRLLLMLTLSMLALPGAAVEPDEILDDPALESRARTLSKDLRCLVCQNESIDESHAELAKDLRLLVRERLVAGDTDDEVMAYVVDRYGEFVLLNPTLKGANVILWIAGPAMLVLALSIAGLYLRRRRSAPSTEALSEDGQARLREILKE